MPNVSINRQNEVALVSSCHCKTFVNSMDPDQPVCLRSLISVYVVRLFYYLLIYYDSDQCNPIQAAFYVFFVPKGNLY